MKAYIELGKCTGCGQCVEVCHKKAPFLYSEGVISNPR